MKSVTFKRLTLSITMLAVAGFVYADTKGTLSNPWSGMYLGFNLGGVFNQEKLNAHQLGFDNLAGVCDSNSSNFSSLYPGLELGYTYQLASKLVMGVLGDYSYNVNRTKKLACVCPFNVEVWDRFTVQNDIQGSLLGRLGYALDNRLLPYISGGVSFASLGLKYTNEAVDFYSKNSSQVGWRVGGGIEWGIAPNWSLSAEYHYMGYNAFNMDIPLVYSLFDPSGNANLRMNTNNIQASIKYWFN